MKLIHKIFLSFFATLLIVFSISDYYFVYSLLKTKKESIKLELKNNKNKLKEEVNRVFILNDFKMQEVLNDKLIKEYYKDLLKENNNIVPNLLDLKSKISSDYNYIFFDNEANFIFGNFELNRYYIQEILQNKKEILLSNKKRNILFISKYKEKVNLDNFAVFKDGNNNVLGYFFIRTSFDENFVDYMKSKLSNDIVFNYLNFKVLSTIFDKNGKRVESDFLYNKKNKTIVLNNLEYISDFFTLEFRNEKLGDFYLISDSLNKMIEKDIFIKHFIMILLLTIFISILLTFCVLKVIIKPILILKKYIELVSENNFEFEINSKYLKRRDEIGFLVKTFEKMRNGTLLNQKKIKFYNKELESSYKEMKNYLYILELKNKEMTEKINEQELIKSILIKGIEESKDINVFLKYFIKKIYNYKKFKRAEIIFKGISGDTYDKITYISEEDRFIEDIYNKNLKYLLPERIIIKDNNIELPIIINNNIIGSVKFKEIEITDNFEKILEIILNELKIIIDNSYLYYNMDKKIMELSFLNSIAVSISSANNLNAMKKSIRDAIAVLFNIVDFQIYIYENGYFFDFREEEEGIVKIKKMKIEDVDFYIKNKYETIKVDKYYYIPLVVKNSLIGVIRIDNLYNIKRTDNNVLKIFLTQLSIIIQNTLINAESIKINFRIIKTLATAIEEKDFYTRGHSERVTKYAVKIAERLKYPKEYINKLKYAAILHDVGKIGIPENILNKKGILSEEEYEIIKQHPEKGAKILSHIPSLGRIIDYVRFHHERPDGKGYPNNLKSDEIPDGAKILSLADTLDAMTSDRPYRKGLPLDIVIKEIKKNLGKQFDCEMGKVVIDMIIKKELIPINEHYQNK